MIRRMLLTATLALLLVMVFSSLVYAAPPGEVNPGDEINIFINILEKGPHVGQKTKPGATGIHIHVEWFPINPCAAVFFNGEIPNKEH